MHDSMMIAEVGGIVNVSGSRIATPFAPPSPGSTPMITPSTTPTNISIRLNGVSATANPWISEPISSNAPPISRPRRGARSVELEPRFERPLRQRDLEPHLEQQEEHDAHPDRHRDRARPGVAPQPTHEECNEDRRGNID